MAVAACCLLSLLLSAAASGCYDSVCWLLLHSAGLFAAAASSLFAAVAGRVAAPLPLAAGCCFAVPLPLLAAFAVPVPLFAACFWLCYCCCFG